MGSTRLWTAVAGCIAAGLVAGPPAYAFDVDVSDKTANRSRTFKAYLADAGTLFEIAFRTTTTGEKRRVSARLEVSMPSTTSDTLLATRQAIRCAPTGSADFEQVYGVQNVLRGTSMTLTPRFTFTAGAPGAYHCWLWVNSGRPLPSSQRVQSNVFTIGWGSYLLATEPVHSQSGQSFAPKQPSRLLTRGQASDESVLYWTAPSTSTFRVSGDAYLTTCSVVGGSTDPVTGKRLCEGHANPVGSTVNTRLIVRQLSPDGSGTCALSYFPSRTGRETYISKSVHHRLLYQTGAVPVRTGGQCGRRFKIKIYVRVVSGAAVMVHRQGTLTSAVPPS